MRRLNSLKRLMGTASYTNIFIVFLKNLCVKYRSVELWLDKIYTESQIHKLIKVFYEGTKINFRYSFLGKITKIEWRDGLVILDNSKLITSLLKIYKACNYRITGYLGTSAAVNLEEEIKKELYFIPVKITSIVIITAISSNIFFSILVRKEIGLLSWIVNILFLFMGIGGLFCNANYEKIRRTSLVLRHSR